MSMLLIVNCIALSSLRQVEPVDLLSLNNYATKTVAFTTNTPNSSWSKSHIFCGGVRIKYNLILTAYHCVKYSEKWCTNNSGKTIDECNKVNANKKTVMYYYTYMSSKNYGYEKADSSNYKKYIQYIGDPNFAYVVKIDQVEDLALLKTNLLDYHIAYLRNRDEPSGNQVSIIGHSQITAPYSFLGARVKYHGYLNGSKQWVMTVDKRVRGGTSGGGAWNKNEELVGICLSRSRMDLIPESYFASAEAIGDFLKDTEYYQ